MIGKVVVKLPPKIIFLTKHFMRRQKHFLVDGIRIYLQTFFFSLFPKCQQTLQMVCNYLEMKGQQIEKVSFKKNSL